MTSRSAFALALAVGATLLGSTARHAKADGSPLTKPVDESALGTVVVDGAASGASLAPLAKIAIVPLANATTADTQLAHIVRGDLDLSGQFQVQSATEAPAAKVKREVAIDLPAYAKKGADYVVRVFADTTKSPARLVAEAYLPPSAAAAKSGAPKLGATKAAPQKPAFRGEVEIDAAGARVNAHRLVDKLLGGLTGRPGGFASQLAFTGRAGSFRRVFTLDADGADLQAISPEKATAISPAIGPGGRVFYALSTDYSPFRLAEGTRGLALPFSLPGSVLGVAFSSDASKAAFTVMNDGRSSLWIAEDGAYRQVDAPSHANHPAFGPLGKIAYAAGSPVQRIHVNGKPMSPPGFHASAPVFCDAPEGLLVLFAIEVAGGSDIVAMDSSGGAIRRLTQNQGANSSPACSPDGRLVAFFSTQKTGKGPGLYVTPIARPWLAKPISTETGESLTWAPRSAH